MDYDEWQANWLKVAEDRGHKLRRDESDAKRIDIFALDSGYHNGPRCDACGWSACMHCKPDADAIPNCTAKAEGQ